MKKIIYLLMLGVFASFAACSDDDDDNSNQTINVAGSDFTVYGIDSYYSQAMEQFVIGFMLHKEMIVNNDIYFESEDFDLNSLAKGKVYQINDYVEDFMNVTGKNPVNSFTAYINDLHNNTAPVYSKEGTLTILEYDAESMAITAEFNVMFKDFDDTYEKQMTGTVTFNYYIDDIQE